jgi:hypothetical protein
MSELTEWLRNTGLPTCLIPIISGTIAGGWGPWWSRPEGPDAPRVGARGPSGATAPSAKGRCSRAQSVTLPGVVSVGCGGLAKDVKHRHGRRP